MAIAIVIVLIVLHVLQTLNLRIFRRLRKAPAEVGAPLVPAGISVLIPARDEERNIERCVRSLSGQPNVLEVLVLDDQSTDRTAEIVAAIAAPDVRLLHGTTLPPGWRGKNWACHQLAQAARGEWLLFTDADTIHERDSIPTSLNFAIDTRADLLSLFPRQLAGTWLERLIIPLLNFMFVTFFPAFMLERSRAARFHAANGQFLLFRRQAYEQIGGHESIRGSIVDDLALARRVREEQLRLRVADGQDLLSCRMYDTARGVIDGFTKNLFAATGEKASRAIGIALFLLVLFVVPSVMAIDTLDRRWIAAVALGIALRLRVTMRRSDDSFLSALLHPLGVAFAVILLLRSMTGVKVMWKGRAI